MDEVVDRHTGPWVRFDGVLVPQANPPLFFIDDVRVEEAELRALDEDDVYSIEVLQGPVATQRYGPEALGRVISVVTKRGPVIERALAVGGPGALLYIDGVQVQGVDFRALDPNVIESIEIIKGPAATARFGPEAMEGVITVVTKRN
jgi:outer membrane cobalamin receptor